MKHKRTADEFAAEVRWKQAVATADELIPFFDALVGKGPDVQGAVLAQLTARWLAGHVVPGSREKTDTVRQRIFIKHNVFVWRLVAAAEQQIGAAP